MSLQFLNPYGILLSISLMVGIWMIFRRASEYKLAQTELEELFLLLIPTSFLGARLFHVFTNWADYRQHLMYVFYVWQGGLAYLGGFFAAIALLGFYSRARKVGLNSLLNLFVVPLPLVEAIGRLGNLFNQELLPFAYGEIILNLLIFVYLYWLEQRASIINSPLLWANYLITYGVGRFLLEFVRSEPSLFLGLNLNQCLLLMLALFGALIHLRIHLRSKTIP